STTISSSDARSNRHSLAVTSSSRMSRGLVGGEDCSTVSMAMIAPSSREPANNVASRLARDILWITQGALPRDLACQNGAPYATNHWHGFVKNMYGKRTASLLPRVGGQETVAASVRQPFALNRRGGFGLRPDGRLGFRLCRRQLLLELGEARRQNLLLGAGL